MGKLNASTLVALPLLPLAFLAPQEAPAQVGPCDASQSAIADAAMAKAKNMVSKATSALKARDPLAVAKASSWFGANDAATLDAMATRLAKIWAVTGSISFRCSVQSVKQNHGVFASINPAGLVALHIGPSFWKAPDGGFQSKAGVMIHEGSHLTIAGGANAAPPYDTEIYGEQAALALAAKSPQHAQNNAENVQLFVESLVQGLNP